MGPIITPGNQSPVEEIFNSVLHGIGILLALTALVLLIIKFNNHSPSLLISSISFSIALAILFLMSVLHHSLVPKTAKHIFLILDYAAIYIVIGATYSPFLIILHKTQYMLLLISIWLLSITGIILSAIFSRKIKTIAPIFYISLGWIALLIIKPLYYKIGPIPTVLLLIGGCSYTIGTYFYLNDSNKYYHAIWHGAVLIGATVHTAAILLL